MQRKYKCKYTRNATQLVNALNSTRSNNSVVSSNNKDWICNQTNRHTMTRSADGVVTAAAGVTPPSRNRCVPTPSIVRALTHAAEADDTTTTTTSDAGKVTLKEARAFVTALEDAFDELLVASSSSSASVLLACATHAPASMHNSRCTSLPLPPWSDETAANAAAAAYEERFGKGAASSSEKTTRFKEICVAAIAPALSVKDAAIDDQHDLGRYGARVAVRQLLWCLARDDVWTDLDSTVVVVADAALPCVLRAMDYPDEEVRIRGTQCASELVERLEYYYKGKEEDGATIRNPSVLLDAARSCLIGATEDLWPHALRVACDLTCIIGASAGESEVFRKTLTLALDSACLRAMDVKYATSVVECFPRLIQAAKACVVVHLKRLLPLLCGYMQSYKDEVAIGAADLLIVVVEYSWPRARAHCERMWPPMKRAYAEADSRVGNNGELLRRKLEKLAALLQLACGETFEELCWKKKGDDVPEHARGLVRFLESLPPRIASSS